MSTPAPTDLPTDAGAAKAPDAGAGPAGTAEEERALPPSMTPNLPGIDGLSEEEIACLDDPGQLLAPAMEA